MSIDNALVKCVACGCGRKVRGVLAKLAVVGVGVVAGVSGAGEASGQCGGRWFAGPVEAPRGAAYTSMSFDFDGAGSQPARLVVGGHFSRAGGPGAEGALAESVAWFDGANWSAVGGGLVPFNELLAAGGVYALTTYGSNLVAGGSFTVPGGGSRQNLARFNGTTWTPLVSGSLNGRVRALAVYNGELIAGGEFTQIGSVTVNGIAAYNGTSWRALGSGFSGGSFETGAFALAVYNRELIAAGEFDTAGGVPAKSIAKWNGTRWASLGGGLTSSGRVTSVHALALDTSGGLVAGGDFNDAGGTAARDVARWNGSTWSAMGAGLNGPVYSLRTIGGTLYAGGSVEQVSGPTIRGMARWTGSAWVPLTSGGDVFGYVYTMTEVGGQIYAGGYFRTAGSSRVDSVAAWNGSAWLDMPGLIDDPSAFPNVSSLATWNGELVMGGFYEAETENYSTARHMSEWSGRGLRGLQVRPNGAVLAMQPIFRGANVPEDLVIAGAFTELAFGTSDSHNRVALLSTVTDINGRITRPMGSGFNDTVRALARFNGSTVAAGDFTASGVTGINRLARFDGNGWVSFDGAGGADGSVRALKSYTGTSGRIHLLVGGSFTTIAGVAANRVALYTFNTVTPGASWSALDVGFNGRVDALERFGGVTYAAGQFTATGTGTPMNRVARFVGGTWQQVGSGFNGPVSSLFADGPYLYAGGTFTASGGTPMVNFARWDGTSWSAVETGANGSVSVIGKYQGEIVAGGWFSRVGTGSEGGARFGAIESELVARVPVAGVPWIALEGHPESRQVCRDGTWYASVLVAKGYETEPTLTYTWRRNGVPLVAGMTPHGSMVEVSATSSFVVVRGAQPEDAGVYDCVVSSVCGSVTSLGATMTVCPADLNCDNFLDFFDFDEFVAAFEVGDLKADFDRDGFLDYFDFDAFTGAFEAGC